MSEVLSLQLLEPRWSRLECEGCTSTSASTGCERQ